MEIVTVLDIIKPDCIEIYLKERTAIRRRLSNAANNIFILEKISDFPFRLFAPLQEDQHFWNYTYNALFKDTILALWHINWDQAKGIAASGELRLSRFNNKINDTWKRDDIDIEVLEKFRRNLKSVEYERSKISKIAPKIQDIRNEIVAHIDYVSATMDVMLEAHKISLSELKKLLESSEKWFMVLCLGDYLNLNVWEYHENNKWTDIDSILCLVASNSMYLKKHLEDWLQEDQSEEIEKLSEEDRRTLEIWREKIQKVLHLT